MITEEVMALLKTIYADLDKFQKLVGLEYTEDDEYACRNRDQVDENWCDREMLESIENARCDIKFFLGL